MSQSTSRAPLQEMPNEMLMSMYWSDGEEWRGRERRAKEEITKISPWQLASAVQMIWEWRCSDGEKIWRGSIMTLIRAQSRPVGEVFPAQYQLRIDQVPVAALIKAPATARSEQHIRARHLGHLPDLAGGDLDARSLLACASQVSRKGSMPLIPKSKV